MVLYFLIAIWVLAAVPAVVGHRRAHRADALVSFAAFQARGRTLSAPLEPSRSVAQRRQRIAGVLLLGLAVAAVTALVMRDLWAIAVAAGLLHITVLWYGAVVRSQTR